MTNLIGIGIFVVLMALVIGGFRVLDRWNDQATCRAFGEASGRDVEFVDYTFFSWDCLTVAADGKKISATRLREMVE